MSNAKSSTTTTTNGNDQKEAEACQTVVKPTVHTLLSQLNTNDEMIVDFLGSIYEHSPWVAQELVAQQQQQNMQEQQQVNMTTITQLADAMRRIVDASSYERKLALLQAHPDLRTKAPSSAAAAAAAAELTVESQQEQAQSGLSTMTADELQHFHQMNDAYRTKFGFPFILAVRHATKYTILAALRGRMGNAVEVEFVQALQQVHKIAWMRLLEKLDTSDASGYLTCHVLDTANGIPAANMRIQLHRLSPAPAAGLIGEYVTNNDGRLEQGAALRGGTEMLVGEYEWTFFVGDYFASVGTTTTGQPFLDVIPLRFGIDNPDDHYHVPLLASPWSFSTYRGS